MLNFNDKNENILKKYINGLVQACGNSIANAMELPESCAKLYLSLTLKLTGV